MDPSDTHDDDGVVDFDRELPADAPDPQLPRKLSPSDPRLKLQAAPGRQLSKARIYSLLAAFSAICIASFAMASEPAERKKSPPRAERYHGAPFSEYLIQDTNAPKEKVGAEREQVAGSGAGAPKLPAVPGGRVEGRPAADPGSADPDVQALDKALAQPKAQTEPAPEGILADIGDDPTIPDEGDVGGDAELEETVADLGGATVKPGEQSAADGAPQGTRAAARKGSNYLKSGLQRPRSPYEIKVGWVVPAVLQTAINSDLAGPVIARVRENVCDSVTGEHLLIPQGATVVGSYDSMIAWGQERVLLCWHRLVLPNGESLDLECMPAADLAGNAGLTGDVDEHWWRVVKGAMLTSLLSATTTAAAGNTQGYNPTVPQLWARGAAMEFGQAGQEITRRNLQVKPTIKVPAGTSMNVMVTKDMILKPYPAMGCGGDG